MAKSNLVDHQTNTGAMLNLAYNPSAMDRFKSQKNEDESPVAGGRRPDWIDNPPEGMRVSKGTSKSMGLAKQKAGAGGTQTHTEADNGVYTVYVLMPAPDRPEEPLQDTEDTDIGLGDYESPELEIDLEGLAPEEEEEKEEAVTSPASRMSLGYDSDLESQLMGQFDRAAAPAPSRSLLNTPTARRLKEKREANIGALDELAGVGNQQQPAIAESTDYRRGGGQDINVLPARAGAQLPAPRENEMIARYANAAGGPSNPYVTEKSAITTSPAPSVVQEEEEQGGGFMSRLAGLGGDIGGFVKDNPDLMLQGLQTVGELGGAYKRSRREEEAAKRMAEEARMGTAISALTRGRVNPSVAPQMPRTSAGEGMFDVMAGIGRGGKEFMGQKRGLEERERLEKMQDEEITRLRGLEDAELERETEALAYQKIQDLRAQGLDDEAVKREMEQWEKDYELRAYEAKTGRMGAVAKALPGKGGKDAFDPQVKKQIDQVLTRLEKHVEDPKYGTTAGMSGLGPPGAGLAEAAKEWLPGAQYLDFVKNPEYFRAQTADIVFRVLKPLSKEGRLSQTDYDNLERMVGRPDMSKELVQDLLANIRESVEEVQTNAPGTHSTWEDGGDSTWKGADQYSDDELSDLSEDEILSLSADDLRELKAEMNKRGLQ